MTRCLLQVGLIVLTLGAAADAKPRYGMAGCGLGSQVFDADRGQISAATTNGSFSSQGFGITSGTSNCIPGDAMEAVAAQERFMIDNFSVIAKEMARGEGESLTGLAATMGCKMDAYPRFAATMQDSYRSIYSSPGAMAVLSAIRAEVRADAALAQSCNPIL
jgi:hypothetical protein